MKSKTMWDILYIFKTFYYPSMMDHTHFCNQHFSALVLSLSGCPDLYTVGYMALSAPPKIIMVI